VTASWMERREEQVEAAVAEIDRLREENERLRDQVEGLGSDGDAGAAARWKEEKAEVRQRVERLADQLEALLPEA